MGDLNYVDQAKYDPHTLSQGASPGVTQLPETLMEFDTAALDPAQMGFKPPSEFEPSTSLRSWRRKVEFFLSSIPRDQQAPYILYLLSDTVLDILFGYNIPPEITAEEVWAVLEENFGSRENPATFIRLFWNRSQEECESPDAFAAALRMLVVKAYPNQPAEMRNLLVLQQFKLGLRDARFVDKFSKKRPPSLTKARSTVVDPSLRTLPCLAVGPSNSRPIPEFGAPSSRPLHTQNIICYQCGKSGHIARNCPGRDNGHPECRFCRKFGKAAQTCGHNSSRPATVQRNR
ncbi:unnamed protein product [Calicophoron daubneyi]|uniref:CCHC-type domain-containing protein n=1 Tax=Calicophoron daubneyi TaxID=300641 RepID=A0AAV2T3W3_CALDB